MATVKELRQRIKDNEDYIAAIDSGHRPEHGGSDAWWKAERKRRQSALDKDKAALAKLGPNPELKEQEANRKKLEREQADKQKYLKQLDDPKYRSAHGISGNFLQGEKKRTQDRINQLADQIQKMTPQPVASNVSPAQAQAAQAMGPAAGGDFTAPPPDPVQQALDSGDTKALQTALNNTGANLKVDGILGRQTKAALAAYQGAHPNVTSTAPAVPPATTMRRSTGGGGGGGGGTTTAPATNPPAAPTPKTDQEIVDYARANYGYGAMYLDDPEIGPILKRAAREGWDGARLEGALFNTNWWKSTNANQRTWDKLASTDPATAQQQITDKATALSTQAKAMGITIDAGRINQIAQDSLRNNWSQQQVQQALGHEFHYQTAQGGQSRQSGEALNIEQQLKDTAHEYLMPISDATLGQWEQQILSGDVTADQFQAYAREQAKSLFPGLAKAIDSGVTVRQYVQPYAERAAQLLEVNPNQIDFMDSKFMRGISQIDPKTGDRTAMSLADWDTYIKSLPEWRKTRNANETASGLADQLARTFGTVAA